MALIVCMLILIIVILMGYIIYTQAQIRSMNRQLIKRKKDNSRRPVSLELFNRNLNELSANLNQCFMAEETLRLFGVREEKKFRDMIADISHDLRTPLTAVKGYLQLIDQGELSEEQRTRLQIAVKHTQELGLLIEHFFEYAYLINNEPEQHPEYFNLTRLLTDCLAASINALEEHNLALRFDEATPEIFITADKEMVARMLQNLIRNCIQHSSGEIRVRLTGEEEISLSFENTVSNPGDIDVTRIFDRFYTGDKARSRSTGLGLSIVKLLAERMNGRAGAVLQGDMLNIKVVLPL